MRYLKRHSRWLVSLPVKGMTSAADDPLFKLGQLLTLRSVRLKAGTGVVWCCLRSADKRGFEYGEGFERRLLVISELCRNSRKIADDWPHDFF